MKKIKLFAIGNQGRFNYYIFEKTQKAMEEIAKILGILDAELRLFRGYENKKGRWISEKKINFEKKKDEHSSLSYEEDKRIDIFYGDKKVFMTTYCSPRLREKFNKELWKISYMPKPKKVKNSKM